MQRLRPRFTRHCTSPTLSVNVHPKRNLVVPMESDATASTYNCARKKSVYTHPQRSTPNMQMPQPLRARLTPTLKAIQHDSNPGGVRARSDLEASIQMHHVLASTQRHEEEAKYRGAGRCDSPSLPRNLLDEGEVWAGASNARPELGTRLSTQLYLGW